MGDILNEKYLKLKPEPIGEGSQAKVYLYETTKKSIQQTIQSFLAIYTVKLSNLQP